MSSVSQPNPNVLDGAAISSKEAAAVPVAPSPRFIGLDVGDRSVKFHVVDERGRCVDHGSFKSFAACVDQFAARYRGAKALLEACGHSGWMSRRLKEAGVDAVVCKADVLCGRRRRKNDDRDAMELADLLRTGSTRVEPVYVRPEAPQVQMATLTARDALVAARSSLILVVRGVVKTHGARLLSCDANTFAEKAKGELPAELEPALSPLLGQIAAATKQIRAYDRVIEKHLATHEAAPRLRAVPGVGPITTLAYLLIVGDPKRFEKARDVGGYLGLVPAQRDSGEARPEMPISKTGSPRLRRLLVQCAHWIIGPHGKDCDLRAWGLALARRGGKAAKKRAAVAVARRLAVQLLALWKTKRPYDPEYGQKKRTAAA